MPAVPEAGTPARGEDLTDIPRLVSAYFLVHPDPADPRQRVAFGTSGHRGRSTEGSFNEDHIVAITEAIVAIRRERGIDGPLFMGRDTHALSEPAHQTALEVLAAHGVEVVIQRDDGHTPTPVISFSILAHNADRSRPRADGIVITPSHNPPTDGGFKYNPPHGGPADTETTRAIERRANETLARGAGGVERIPWRRALAAPTTHTADMAAPYIEALAEVIDLERIRAAGVRMGADPMGGAGHAYWGRIAERYRLDLEVVDATVDPTFSFMTLDHDGKIRMDCSSPYAMARLVGLRDRFDVAFGNDPDFDRHGIVTPSAGLMNPNHYLSVATWYLFEHRDRWPEGAAAGKTLVTTALIDRIADACDRPLAEVPVGFKWFVEGLLTGAYGIGVEESAGASFLRRDGRVWTTDKDGFISALLAAEITAVMGRDPGEVYERLASRFGTPVYERIDAPATPEQKAVLAALGPDDIDSRELAGEPIRRILTRAPANDAPIGGVKVIADSAWFAARPSGTEEIYKIYAESFQGEEHLRRVQDDARRIVSDAFRRGVAG